MKQNMDRSVKETNNNDILDIKLSLDEKSKETVSDVQKDYLQEEMKDIIPEIKEGEVNVSGVYVFKEGDRYEVKIYLVNGLSQPINFEKIPLCIINSKDEKLAYQIFDFSNMEDIPAHSARPFKVYFDKKNVFVEEINNDDWKVIFAEENVRVARQANIELEKIPEGMDQKEVNTFKEFLESLPKLEMGQASISIFTMSQYTNGNILMTLLIRNATSQRFQLRKMPITIKTQDDKTVLSGVFDIDNLHVNPYKARILSLVFPNDIVLKEEFDLSSCKVIFKRE